MNHTIQWLTTDEYDEWDAFVARHPKGLIYHLTAWQKVLETAFKHIQGQFLVLRDENGQIQAGLPVYFVKSWLIGNRTVSVPFSTMCDPLISTEEELNLLLPAIETESVSQESRRIEIRTRLTNSDYFSSPFSVSDKYKHHYLPLDKPTDELFRSFNKSNIQRAVNHAQQEGIVVEERYDEDSLREFHAILGATRHKHLLPPMPFAFFQAMHRVLSPDHITLYLALHEGKPVAGILVSKFKDFWTSEYSGMIDESPRGTSPYIYWETIQEAKNNGAANFSFGRTSLENTGLLVHKRRWATIEEDLTDFLRPVSAISGQHLEAQEISGERAKYTPVVNWFIQYSPVIVQKIIGNFVYRHLG